jgi:hypothetical protein
MPFVVTSTVQESGGRGRPSAGSSQSCPTGDEDPARTTATAARIADREPQTGRSQLGMGPPVETADHRFRKVSLCSRPASRFAILVS